MKTIHPFSKIGSEELTITGTYNYYVSTADTTYLDGISGLYNCPLGYDEPFIRKAINECLENIPSSHIFSVTPNVSQSNIYLRRLEGILESVVPFAKHLYLTNSGAEAVDSAISLCKLHSKSARNRIMSYNMSYHGSTQATLSISGNLSNTDNLQFVDFYKFSDTRTVDEYLKHIEKRILEIGPETILAFIAEPMIGASGGFLMKENILPGLKKILEKYGIYLILDEVISGFGRLGTMFAWEKYNVIPDILILSKGITNGYMPLACCLTSFEFNDGEVVPFGYTNAGNPASCAAAIASIDMMKRCVVDGTIDSLNTELFRLFSEYGITERCYKIDSSGLFVSLHFSQSVDSYVPFTKEKNIGGTLAEAARKRGVILRGNFRSLIVSPGYLMNFKQLENIAIVLDAVLNENL